jgi:hypothetical protein
MITNSGISDFPTVFSESVLGATVTFESTANLAGVRRFVGLQQGVTSNGLHLAGGGGSTLEFTVSSNTDILLESYSTDTGGFFVGDATLDIVGLGVSSLGNSLDQGVAENLLAGGPVTLLAGEIYTFEIQDGGAVDQAFISEFSFKAIPEPGSACVLLFTILATGFVRRRQ